MQKKNVQLLQRASGNRLECFSAIDENAINCSIATDVNNVRYVDDIKGAHEVCPQRQGNIQQDGCFNVVMRSLQWSVFSKPQYWRYFRTLHCLMLSKSFGSTSLG